MLGYDPVLRAIVLVGSGGQTDTYDGCIQSALSRDVDTGEAVAAATRMEPTNGRRVVRALEVVLIQGSMPGEMTAYEPWVPTVYLGLDREDRPLQPRIDSWPAPGEAYTGFGEQNQRSMLRLWGEYMLGNGRVAAGNGKPQRASAANATRA